MEGKAAMIENIVAALQQEEAAREAARRGGLYKSNPVRPMA
jgi:hypothetical protein